MCFPGSFSSLPNASQCELCPQHTYNTVVDAVTCYRCPYGSYTPDVGSIQCTPCTEGNLTYLESNPMACALNTPTYSNVIAVGIGMLLLFGFLAVLVRYYAVRKKVQTLYLEKELHKRARQSAEPYNSLITKSPDIEEMHSDDGDLFPASLSRPDPPKRQQLTVDIPRNSVLLTSSSSEKP